MNKKILAAIPVYHSVYPEAAESLLGLAAKWGFLCGKGGFDITIKVIPRAIISEARTAAVNLALTEGAEYLMFLDDDMIFPNDTLERLLMHDVDIVSVMAYKRTAPYEAVPMNWSAEKSFHHWDETPESGLKECVCTGCAGMLIKTKVFEKICPPHFLFYKTPMGTISEDSWFCLQARKHGFKVWVDCGLKVLHIETPRGVGETENKVYQKFVGKSPGGGTVLVTEQGEAIGTSNPDLADYWTMGQEVFDALPEIVKDMEAPNVEQ